MTLIYWLLATGFVGSVSVFAWCVIRLDDQTHHKTPQRPTLDSLTTYLLERDVKRALAEDYDQLLRESEWRSR